MILNCFHMEGLFAKVLEAGTRYAIMIRNYAEKASAKQINTIWFNSQLTFAPYSILFGKLKWYPKDHEMKIWFIFNFNIIFLLFSFFLSFI